MANFVDCWNQLKSKGYKHADGSEVLNDADRASIEARIQEHLRTGLDPIEAAKASVKSHLDEAHAQLQSIYDQVIPKDPRTYYRGGGPSSPPRGRTAQDIFDYETKELGNKIVAENGVDLSKIPAERTQWVSPTEQGAAVFGNVESVSGNFRVLARDPDGGMLVEKSAPVSEAGQAPAVAGKPKTEGGVSEEKVQVQGQEKGRVLAETPAAAVPPAESSSTEPHVSRIANRFTEERVKTGELGEIAPGQGYSTQELVQRGLKMRPEEINQHVSDLMQGTGDIVKQGQAVRAEEARLSQRSNQLSSEYEADPTNMDKKLAADNAFKDLTDFHNGPIAVLKNKWHQTGMEMQSELPVDLSTYNGMREAWLKDVGTPPPPEVEPILRDTAKKVATANGEADAAITKVGKSIEQATKGRKTMSYEQVRNNILQRLKERAPCN